MRKTVFVSKMIRINGFGNVKVSAPKSTRIPAKINGFESEELRDFSKKLAKKIVNL